MVKFVKPVIVLLLISFSSITFYYVSIETIPDANETRLGVIMDVLEKFYRILVENRTYRDNSWTGWWPSWTGFIVNELRSIKILVEHGYTEILNRINVSELTYLLAKRQSPWGDFAPLTNYGNNTTIGHAFLTTYEALLALKHWNALDLVNITAVRDFVLRRFDNATGGFKEPVIVINGKEYAEEAFPYVIITSMDMYRVPNLLSTAVAVAILNITGYLDLIDIDRVLDFILSCKNQFGLFMPTPNISALPVPWPYQRGSFVVDSAESGLAYTYAGILSLYYLGRLDVLTIEDRLNIIEYLRLLYDPHEGFRYYLFRRTGVPIYEWVFFIFKVLGFVDEYHDWLLSVMINHTDRYMNLRYDNSFPIPRKFEDLSYGTFYGVFHGWYGYEIEFLYAFSVIDAIDYLNSLTPRALKVRENFAILSIIVGFITFVLYVILPRLPRIFSNLKRRRT